MGWCLAKFDYDYAESEIFTMYNGYVNYKVLHKYSWQKHLLQKKRTCCLLFCLNLRVTQARNEQTAADLYEASSKITYRVIFFHETVSIDSVLTRY